MPAAITPHSKSYDFAVIGAGVFGSWTALTLRQRGASVILLDAYGPASSRASSGGESRIIRMGYGPSEIYTRWSMQALPLWKELFSRAGRPELFQQTGVLWIAHENETYMLDTLRTLEQCGVSFQRLSCGDLRRRYPQIAIDDGSFGIFEPESGVLLARRAVQCVVDHARKLGVAYNETAVLPPSSPAHCANSAGARLTEIKTSRGASISAGAFAFACGPWLPQVFPDLLGDRIFPSRQEIFFFGVPQGDLRFSPPAMPTWLILADEFYGMPCLEGRGFKIAHDRHGQRVNPDSQPRTPSADAFDTARKYLALRFPALKDAPVLESRVCQYENTSNGDFLIDRHPAYENVWIVGGGSGHGFKHGPSVGTYAADRIFAKKDSDVQIEPRFSLTSKETIQHRAVY
ncbi:MAG TPA: FAD-dependent oxidoreductase [Candidatus Acidoferrales bacterium]|nr:FAD-dependent oxidoreductase [Candidatus Acidoferrales bacterium]